jgi:hypothetical protein
MMIVTGAVISKGQTYFGDFALPENSLYKRIESIIAARARGDAGITKMRTADYAAAVVGEITKRVSGKFWYGDYAESVKSVWTPQVPQELLVSSHYAELNCNLTLTCIGWGLCLWNWCRSTLSTCISRREKGLGLYGVVHQPATTILGSEAEMAYVHTLLRRVHIVFGIYRFLLHEIRLYSTSTSPMSIAECVYM